MFIVEDMRRFCNGFDLDCIDCFGFGNCCCVGVVFVVVKGFGVCLSLRLVLDFWVGDFDGIVGWIVEINGFVILWLDEIGFDFYV